MSDTVQIRRRTIGVAISLVLALVLIGIPGLSRSSDAQDTTGTSTLRVVTDAPTPAATELIVVGVGTRNISYDGAVGRFTVSVLRDSIVTAVNDGNRTLQDIAAAVEESCSETEPESADHTADPTCISPAGLETLGIRIEEEFDWTEAGRVSRGFRYENQMQIAIRGTGFAGGLVDLVISSGGDNTRFDGLSFTASQRPVAQQKALLAAVDDARSTAEEIASHIGFEIVRIAKIAPVAGYTPFREIGSAQYSIAADELESVPTPVFAGSATVTAQVDMVFEIREIAG